MMERNLDSKVIVEVINKIAGPINAVGCSEVDSERYENLDVFLEVIETLIDEVCEESLKFDSCMYSVSRSGKRCMSMLRYLKEKIEETLESDE